MKTFWKWFLGILAVVLVVGALVAVPLVMRNVMFARGQQVAIQQQDRPGRGAGAWQDDDGWQRPGFGRMGPGMMGRGGFSGYGGGFPPFGMGFMMVGMFFRGLLPLALLGLLVWWVYGLGKRSSMPVAAVPAPPVIQTHACAKCGASVQDGWQYCPSCGKKQ